MLLFLCAENVYFLYVIIVVGIFYVYNCSFHCMAKTNKQNQTQAAEITSMISYPVKLSIQSQMNQRYQ